MTNRNSLPFAETVAWLQGVDLADHAAVEDKARLLLLDTIACAVAGMVEPELKALGQGLQKTASGSVQWPAGPALVPASAAFLSAVSACWHEACEGLARAHGRPGLHAIPVAVSLGLANGATLRDVLEAIVYGYEIGGRAGEAMRIRGGLHVDGTWGVFAAVAAAARLQKCDAATTIQALAIAACQITTSLYAPITAGRTARNTYVGHAASWALHAVESAAAGITAPDTVFEQAAQALGEGAKATSWPWADAGEFLILQSYLKPFAAVRHVHYSAACALQRFAAKADATVDITAITLHTYPEALTYCGNRNARTAIQAQFSLTHGTVFALRNGSLGPEAYAPSVFQDPEHARLEKLISLVPDHSIANRGARLSVVTRSGTEEYAVSSVLGDPDLPLSQADVATKAKAYMSSVIDAAQAQGIIDYVLNGKLDAPFTLPRGKSSPQVN
ncbi:MAG: MmgE/PrpD family protein [Rhodospirillaceae bacterium]|nr:MmgE/PrpD family protein [Rhodospirillaceae bacterium]